MALERGDCPAFWFPFKDRCYKYMASPMSWIEAEIFCLSQGTNLVSIHNQEEQEFVKSLIGNFDPTRSRTWIGLRDKDKEHFFMWTDGCPMQFDHWLRGEPNNHGGHEHCVDVNAIFEFQLQPSCSRFPPLHAVVIVKPYISTLDQFRCCCSNDLIKDNTERSCYHHVELPIS
ncbi:hypothetical protein WMY93_005414 [Mugilogobius chulae]|uniref:C-type lectin domain-containing protein n=1 Tax=Mugilogobius chulae TaxID=88201 RepID=A0AAW0PSH1_9GOBI